MRQRAVKGLLSGYIFNGYRRLSAQLPYWIIPFAVGEYTSPFLCTVSDDHWVYSSHATSSGYGTYTWAKSYDKWQNSKAGHVALGGHH